MCCRAPAMHKTSDHLLTPCVTAASVDIVQVYSCSRRPTSCPCHEPQTLDPRAHESQKPKTLHSLFPPVGVVQVVLLQPPRNQLHHEAASIHGRGRVQCRDDPRQRTDVVLVTMRDYNLWRQLYVHTVSFCIEFKFSLWDKTHTNRVRHVHRADNSCGSSHLSGKRATCSLLA